MKTLLNIPIIKKLTKVIYMENKKTNNPIITHNTLLVDNDVYLEEVQRQETKNSRQKISTDTLQKKRKNILEKMHKELTLENASILLPEGKEKIFLAIYALVLPYITGLFFLFFYICEGNFTLFNVLMDSHSYFLTWCIGYEILMIMTLVILALKNLMIMRKKNPNTLKIKSLKR